MRLLLAALTASVLLGLGGASARVADFDETNLERRSLAFGPDAGDLAIEVLSARYGCLFEGADGRRSPRVWLLSRAGVPVAVTPVTSFALPAGEGPGRLRPPATPLIAAQHGQLPLADGPMALEARLIAQAWSPDTTVALRCLPAKTTPTRRRTALDAAASVPVQVMGLVAFSPIILFGVPAENASRAAAARAGPTTADDLTPGQVIPGGLETFARTHRGLVRVLRDPGSDYAIVTIDLGGPARYGVGALRDAAFFGVRGDVVEWRGGRDMGIESALCARRDGAFGGRPGCTKTGYYSPAV